MIPPDGFDLDATRLAAALLKHHHGGTLAALVHNRRKDHLTAAIEVLIEHAEGGEHPEVLLRQYDPRRQPTHSIYGVSERVLAAHNRFVLGDRDDMAIAGHREYDLARWHARKHERRNGKAA